jgi:hypothetical protein
MALPESRSRPRVASPVPDPVGQQIPNRQSATGDWTALRDRLNQQQICSEQPFDLWYNILISLHYPNFAAFSTLTIVQGMNYRR